MSSEELRTQIKSSTEDTVVDGYIINKYGVVMNPDIEILLHLPKKYQPSLEVEICCINGWWYEATSIDLSQSYSGGPVTLHFGYATKAEAVRKATDHVIEYCKRPTDRKQDIVTCALIIEAIKDYWQKETGPEQLSLF